VRVIRLSILVIVLSIAAAARATAGPDPQGLFVDLRLGGDRDDTRPDYAISGTTRRIGVALGYDWGRSGLELDVAVPEWHTAVYGSTFVFAGTSGALEKQGHTYESIQTVRRRAIDVTVLYRLNVPLNRRITLTGLLGGGQVYRPEHENPTLNEVLADGTRQNVSALSRTTSRDYLVAVTGLDFDVRVVGQLWVGPRFSLTMYPSLLDDSGSAPRGFVGRSALAVRWRF